MTYLLDTNVLIYLLCNPKELSEEANRILLSEQYLFVSIASLWEIAIKQSLGKLSMPLDIQEIAAVCKERNICLVQIDAKAIEQIKHLPDIHRDPFDRLIVAQAQTKDFTIITRDKTIPLYPVQTIW